MDDLFSRISGAGGDVRQAVTRHISALLNTRRGSLAHLPDYGLPEFNTHGQPLYAKRQYIQAIKTVIERYETRISSVFIEEEASGRHDCVLQLKISATVSAHLMLAMQAVLLSGGEMLLLGERA